MVYTSKNTFNDVIFPFQDINNKLLSSLFSDYEITDGKLKCSECKQRTKPGSPVAYCCECRYYFHLKCQGLTKKDIPLTPDWICQGCIMKAFPFSSVTDENMKLTNHGLSDDNIEFAVKDCPSFSIKSLLDQMPGQKIETDQFMTNTIHSKYYTISDFLSAKFSNKIFSIFHLNISIASFSFSTKETFLAFLDKHSKPNDPEPAYKSNIFEFLNLKLI